MKTKIPFLHWASCKRNGCRNCLCELQKSFSYIKVVLILLLATPCMAQPESARVSFIASGPATFQATCVIALDDTTDIQLVELELVDLMNHEVLFTREFVFDQTTGLPSGISWQREGTQVTLGLGILPEKFAWQGKVRLKNDSGQWSLPFEFLFN